MVKLQFPIACAASLSDITAIWTDCASQDGLANVGEIITLNFGILNTGDATLTEFCLTDAHLGDGCLECSALDPGSLAADEVLSCAFTHKVRIQRRFHGKDRFHEDLHRSIRMCRACVGS